MSSRNSLYSNTAGVCKATLTPSMFLKNKMLVDHIESRALLECSFIRKIKYIHPPLVMLLWQHSSPSPLQLSSRAGHKWVVHKSRQWSIKWKRRWSLKPRDAAQSVEYLSWVGGKTKGDLFLLQDDSCMGSRFFFPGAILSFFLIHSTQTGFYPIQTQSAFRILHSPLGDPMENLLLCSTGSAALPKWQGIRVHDCLFINFKLQRT